MHGDLMPPASQYRRRAEQVDAGAMNALGNVLSAEGLACLDGALPSCA
jgi:hypothetical protein